MTARKSAATTKPANDGGGIFLDDATTGNSLIPSSELETDDDGLDDALHNALTMLAGGGDPNAVVKIYRVTKGATAGEFCMQMTPSEFAENHESVIQNAFGGGKYMVRIYGSNPNNGGRVSMLARGEVNIAEPRNAVVESAALPNALLSRLEQIEQNLKPVTTSPGETVDVMTRVQQGVGIFAGIVTALTPLVAPLLSRPQNNGNNLKDMIDNMMALKTLSGELGGGGGGEKTDAQLLMEAVQGMAPVMLEAIRNNQTPAPVQPAPEPVAVLPNPTQESAPAMDMFALQLSMVANAAAKNADVATWSDTILDACSEQQEGELLTLLNAPDWFEQLCARNPFVTPHRAWFEKLRAEIQAQYTDAPADDKQTGNVASINKAAATKEKTKNKNAVEQSKV